MYCRQLHPHCQRTSPSKISISPIREFESGTTCWVTIPLKFTFTCERSLALGNRIQIKHSQPGQGHPVSDNQNIRTVGNRGPRTLENYHFIEKISHFDRERIPERVVHARGAGAHGYFRSLWQSRRTNRSLRIRGLSFFREAASGPLFSFASRL